MDPNFQEALKAIRNKSLQQVDSTVSPESNVEVPQDTPEPSPAATGAAQAETETPEVNAQDNNPPVVDETPAPEPQSWDEEPASPAATTTESKFDFKKLGSALDLGEINSEDEVVEKVKSKLKSLEDNALQGIPDEFKEVIKISKVGDWKEFIANQMVDYTKLDPVLEFENDFLLKAQRNPKYLTTDGKFDVEKAEEALDAIPEVIRESYGTQMIDAKIQLQQRRAAEMQQAAQSKIDAAEKSLTTAAKNLNEILPFESYGIKFEQKHSAEVLSGIQSSKLTKKHLGVSYEDLIRSGADMKAVAATIAKAEYTEKMLKFKSGASKVEAKKELLQKTQNPQLTNTGTKITPTNAPKVLSPAEKLAAWKGQGNRGL